MSDQLDHIEEWSDWFIMWHPDYGDVLARRVKLRNGGYEHEYKLLPKP